MLLIVLSFDDLLFVNELDDVDDVFLNNDNGFDEVFVVLVNGLDNLDAVIVILLVFVNGLELLEPLDVGILVIDAIVLPPDPAVVTGTVGVGILGGNEEGTAVGREVVDGFGNLLYCQPHSAITYILKHLAQCTVQD